MSIFPTFRRIAATLVFLALIASGCQVVRPPFPLGPTPARGDATALSPSSATPAAAPASTVTPTVAPRRSITLAMWVPDTLVPPGSMTATMVLNQQIAAFAASQPDVRVQVLIKRAHGPGGILDLMQTAAPVAPSALPDVALLDLASVPLAAQAGLLRPLNSHVPDEALAD